MMEDERQRMEVGGLKDFFSGFHLSGEVLPGRGTQALQAPGQELDKFKVSVSFDRSVFTIMTH